MKNEPEFTWEQVWTKAISKLVSTAGLEALKQALETNNPELRQGHITTPVPWHNTVSLPVESACAISFCGWRGEDLNTVGEVEEYFARICFGIDQLLNSPASCRFFLNWFDQTPREEMRTKLLEAVNRTLGQHSYVSAPCGSGGKLEV